VVEQPSLGFVAAMVLLTRIAQPDGIRHPLP
jgi:hypothetical protein